MTASTGAAFRDAIKASKTCECFMGMIQAYPIATENMPLFAVTI
ncbi:hypothetical protein [Pseudaminobacter sp. NGMCC 1.201702]